MSSVDPRQALFARAARTASLSSVSYAEYAPLLLRAPRTKMTCRGSTELTRARY